MRWLNAPGCSQLRSIIFRCQVLMRIGEGVMPTPTPPVRCTAKLIAAKMPSTYGDLRKSPEQQLEQSSGHWTSAQWGNSRMAR